MTSTRNEKPPGRPTLATDASSSRSSGEPIAASDVVAVTEEADIAEAEAAEAEALAAAARARARAVRLRRDAATARGAAEAKATAVDAAATTIEVDSMAEDGEAPSSAVEAQPGHSVRSPRSGVRARFIRRPRWTAVAVVASMVLIGASAAAAGTVWWQHREAAQDRQRSAEFAAAARQGVVNLFSLNFNNANGDVQRLIDDTTDDFRKDLDSGRDDFIAVVQDSKVVTTGTVKATAVQSMSTDSAVVLVSATSDVTNSAGAKRDPRTWRLGVTVTRDGGQLKMSKVEFVP